MDAKQKKEMLRMRDGDGRVRDRIMYLQYAREAERLAKARDFLTKMQAVNRSRTNDPRRAQKTDRIAEAQVESHSRLSSCPPMRNPAARTGNSGDVPGSRDHGQQTETRPAKESDSEYWAQKLLRRETIRSKSSPPVSRQRRPDDLRMPKAHDYVPVKEERPMGPGTRKGTSSRNHWTDQDTKSNNIGRLQS